MKLMDEGFKKTPQPVSHGVNTSLQTIYAEHHKTNRERGFSIMKNERGLAIKNIVGDGKEVLDIGCRDGALTSFFSKSNKVLGVDIDETALSEAKANLGIEIMKIDLNGDWKELGDKKFDVVVAGEVLEHLYNPDSVTRKISSHLNSGGKLVGSVPNAFSLKNRLRYLIGQKKYTPLSDPTHINQFHTEELRNILKKSFDKVEIVGLGKYKKLAKFSPNLFGFDLFFICTKK